MASLPAALALAALIAGADGTSPAAEAGAQAPAAAAPAPAKEPAEALLQRCMNAYGGSRARVRLTRVRATGKLRSVLHPGEQGKYARVFVQGRGVRLEVGFAGSAPEVRLLDGARAFRYGEPATPPVVATLQLEAARLDLPMIFEDRVAQLQDQGEVEHEGQKVRVLGMELAPGVRLEAGIDPKTARILYARGLTRTGPRELEVFTVFRDFRMVDGVLVAFHEEAYANGESTGDVDLTSVEFLDDVAESAFQP